MSLEYRFDWKTGESGISLSEKASAAFQELVSTLAASSTDPKHVLETMKAAFGDSIVSSNIYWAEIDLKNAMQSRANNAPRFIDQLWTGLSNLDRSHMAPDAATINTILAQHQIPFRIDPPRLKYLAYSL